MLLTALLAIGASLYGSTHHHSTLVLKADTTVTKTLKEQMAEAKQKAAEAKQREKEEEARIIREAKEQMAAGKEAKKQKSKAEKEQRDSLKAAQKQQKEMDAERARQIKFIDDSVKNLSKNGFSTEEIAAKARTDSLIRANKREMTRVRDSLRQVARIQGMPGSTYRKWLKYFSNYKQDKALFDTYDEIDTTARNYRIKGEKRKQELAKLFNKKNALINKDADRAIHAFAMTQEKLANALESARHYDSLDIAANPKYATVNQYSLRKQRAKQRKQRLWNEIDWQRKMGTLGDEGPSDLKGLMQHDSTLNRWRDSLKVSFPKRFSLHTNTVAWLMGVPNLGLEYDFSGTPDNKYSIILRGYYKPNLNNEHKNPRIAFNVRSSSVELRKYWRTGGMQTVQGLINNIDYQNKPGFYEFHDYKILHEGDSARKGYVQNPEYRGTIYPDAVVRDTASLTGKTVRTDTVDVVSFGWLTRKWQPFRYNVLSGRYVKKPRVKRLYYVGLMAGYEEYHWQLGPTGRQGEDLFAAITAGVVFNLTQWQSGAALDLDLGLAVGAQMNKYNKVGYDTETNCYIFEGTKSLHFTPRPVVKDVHLSLVYTFRTATKKVHNLFSTDEFSKRVGTQRYRNEIHKEIYEERVKQKAHHRVMALRKLSAAKARVKAEEQEKADRKAGIVHDWVTIEGKDGTTSRVDMAIVRKVMPTSIDKVP